MFYKLEQACTNSQKGDIGGIKKKNRPVLFFRRGCIRNPVFYNPTF